MRAIFNLVAAGATAAAFVATVSLPATAACKRYGFTVNDYGKDGPTKDAKSLLDKLIASKMSEQGVKDFHTGKKSVSCELFLNFIVFDEHTCTAEATVCWGGSQLPKSEETAAADEAKKDTAEATEPTATKKDVAKKSEPAAEKKKTAVLKTVADPKKPAGSAESASAPSEAPAHASAAQPASDTTAADTPAKSDTHAAKPVETGSLNEPAKKPAKHHAEKAAPETNDGPPVKLDSGAGYPTPEGPQDDAQ